MKSKITLLGIAALCASSGLMAQQRNVIMYIGDGFGLAAKTATRMAMGQGTNDKRFTSDPGFHILALDNLRYVATVTTHSKNSWITDSAPGAAVYACGKQGKVDNEVLTLDPSTGTPIETILEAAKKEGYAVGIVSTTRITHATPAAFASHIWFRDLEEYISLQYIASTQTEYENILNSSPTASFHYDANRDWVLPTTKVGVELDVILGGGAQKFLPKNVASSNSIVVDSKGDTITSFIDSKKVSFGKGSRADDVDLIEYAKTQKNYQYVNSRDALLHINLADYTETNGKKLLGLFHKSHMSYDQDRQLGYKWEPTLSEMTEIAIAVLKKKSSKGFFLVVEGGRIDHLAHANSGGIEVITGSPKNQYTISADKEAYADPNGAPNGEGTYAATPTTPRTSNVYGSDYVIKEVLAYDYAVAEGRKLLSATDGSKTLIMSSSDHECGGMALVALHDEADLQANGTKIRTYSDQIKKSNSAEKGYATPTGLLRGDGGDNGWYPEYVMTASAIDSKLYPEKKSATSKRIVIAYGSNPVTNGNGITSGGTPGNHTPQDVLVCSDDNDGGTFGAQITGRGLLDNTALTPIMSDFLKLTNFITGLGNPSFRMSQPDDALSAYPNPFTSKVSLTLNLAKAGKVVVDINTVGGQKVMTAVEGQEYASGTQVISINTESLKAGEAYIAVVKVNGETYSTTIIKN